MDRVSGNINPVVYKFSNEKRNKPLLLYGFAVKSLVGIFLSEQPVNK